MGKKIKMKLKSKLQAILLRVSRLNRNILRRVFVIFAVSILLFPYQNCNPVGSTNSTGSGNVDGGSNGQLGGNTTPSDPTTPTDPNDPNPPPPPPPPVGGNTDDALGPCLFTNAQNAQKPVIYKAVEVTSGGAVVNGNNLLQAGNTIDISYGMDGFGTNSGRKFIRVYAHVGDEGTDYDWQALQVNGTNEPTGFNAGNPDGDVYTKFMEGGKWRFWYDHRLDIDFGDAQECLDGTFDMRVRVREQLTGAAAACGNALTHPDDISASVNVRTSDNTNVKVKAISTCLPDNAGFGEPAANKGQRGSKVAIDGNFAVASAPGEDPSGKTNAGVAYVYKRNASNAWEAIKDLSNNPVKLVPSDLVNGTRIIGVDIKQSGSSVTVAIGTSPSTVENTSTKGSVYIYEKGANDSDWILQKVVRAPSSINLYSGFGEEVVLDGNMLIIGASNGQMSAGQGDGEVFIYNNYDSLASDCGGTISAGCTITSATHQVQRPYSDGGTPADPSDDQFARKFGISLDADGGVIAIGSFGGISNNAANGRVFLAKLDSGAPGGVRLVEVSNPYGAGNMTKTSNFGKSVAIKGDTLVVGAPKLAIGGDNDVGSAYVYSSVNRTTLASGSWATLRAKKKGTGNNNDSADANDKFGSSVDINDDVIVVGAENDSGHGGVYIYKMSDVTASGNIDAVYRTRAKKEHRVNGMHFGRSTKVNRNSTGGNWIVIGAPDRTGSQNTEGSVIFKDYSSL